MLVLQQVFVNGVGGLKSQEYFETPQFGTTHLLEPVLCHCSVVSNIA
jgi:hypothetical protein